MSVLRQSLSGALAVSALVLAAACGEVVQPGAPSESPADGPSLGKKPPTTTSSWNLQSTGNTSWSVSLAWNAWTGSSGSFSYRVRDNWGREITVPATQTSVTWKYPAHPPLHNGATYSFSVYAVDATGKSSPSSNTVSVSLPLDQTAPTVPVFTVTSVGTRHISLAWSSTDDSPYMSYVVTKDGVRISSGWIAETTKTFTLLQPGTTYTFTAQARDYFSNVSGGNVSAVSAPFSVATKVNDGSDVTPPTEPAGVWAESYGDLEMQVIWGASTDDVTPRNVILYEIFVNGVHDNSAIGTTQSSVYGVPGENVVTVIAIDEAGNRSTAARTTVFLPF